jgi:dolichol kinase
MRNASRLMYVSLAVIILCLCAVSAKALILRQSTALLVPSRSGLRRVVEVQLSAFTPVQQDVAASALSVAGTIVWLQIWIGLAGKGVLPANLSRKIIHTGSAPLFMCLWPLFSATPNAKYFAAGVVALQMTRLIIAGTQAKPDSSNGVIAARSQELVNAISRSGEKKEALGGPLVYTIVLLISTLLWFRENPAGVVAVSQMAAGDGMADIVGRRWGSQKWSFAPKKSIAGTAAFVVAAFAVTTGLMALYHATGFLATDVTYKWPVVLGISVACAVVELLPLGEDNITVPVAGAALSLLLLSAV